MAGSDEHNKDGTQGAAGAAEAEPNGGGPANGGGAGAGAAGAEASGETPAIQVELLRGELEKAKADLAQRQDQYLRLQAEFENFKKRMHKEQSEQLKYAQLPLLKDLTLAMDNLERALAHIRTQGGAEAQGLAGGIELVAKQVRDTFDRFGMVRVKTAGAPFDPTRHEAVSVVETDEVPENQVLNEFQAGYMLHDRVVRPAMVSVSKRGAAGSPPGGSAAAAKGEAAG